MQNTKGTDIFESDLPCISAFLLKMSNPNRSSNIFTNRNRTNNWNRKPAFKRPVFESPDYLENGLFNPVVYGKAVQKSGICMSVSQMT